MAFNIHVSAKEKKRRLIRAVVEALQIRDPNYLKECALAIQEMKRSEFDKSGKLKAEANGSLDHGGYIAIRFPQELFVLLKRFDKTFGDDSDDLNLVAEEFPDLCDSKLRKK